MSAASQGCLALCIFYKTLVSLLHHQGEPSLKSVSQIHVNLGTNHLIQPNLMAFTLFF